MSTFLKAVSGILITTVICLVLNKRDKDVSALLSIAVCSMVAMAAMHFLEPVVEFLGQLQALGQMDSQMLTVLLKCTGIGLLSEITNLICADSGNAALGKMLQFLASALILWLAIPLLTSLTDLLQDILTKL